MPMYRKRKENNPERLQTVEKRLNRQIRNETESRHRNTFERDDIIQTLKVLAIRNLTGT